MFPMSTEFETIELPDPDDAGAERLAAIEKSIVKKYRKQLWSPFTKAVKLYRLICPGDRIAVCISGGKDSMLMAMLFKELLRHGEQNFEAHFLVMDPGYNRENAEQIRRNTGILRIPVQTFRSDIFAAADSDEAAAGNPCYLCARMRRGHLYAAARDLGCNKIALGHHFDDVIETILMGMLYSGQLQGMMPKLHSTNFPGMELIRPLSLVREEDIIRWAAYNDLQFIRCACRLTEKAEALSGAEQVSKRARTKEIIRELKKENPFIEINLYRSMENVHLGTMREYRDKEGARHNFLDDY
ncbi:MAG: tRNA 2-thiocytidine biosynthesis protein TtcA [Lachnospiraceae bacterium]|nr:tRNA 2-thiocytidine biosynthesis protein TtcA [Lachnospiraceae bacterium]